MGQVMGSHGMRQSIQDMAERRAGKALRLAGYLSDTYDPAYRRELSKFYENRSEEQRDGTAGRELAAALADQGVALVRKQDVTAYQLRSAIRREMGLGAQAHQHRWNEACEYCVNRAVTAVLRQLGMEP